MTISERFLALLLLVAATAAPAQSLKIATVAPEGSAWMREMRVAAEQAEAASEGRVKIKYYPGGVMGNDATVLRKIRLGQLQGGALTGSELSTVFKDSAVYSLPFLFRSSDEVAAVRQQFDARIAEGLKANGFQMLSLSGVGFAYLMSSGDLSSRSALEQRKVWVPQNDLIAERTFRLGGIAPIPLQLPDVFTALQTGLVDTVGNTPAGAIALQWHGRLRQVLDLPLTYVTGYVVVNDKAWQRLSEADQQTTLKAFAEAGARIDASNRTSDAEAMEALRELGVAQLKPTTAEAERWYGIGREVRRSLVADQALSADLVDAIQQRLDSVRGSAPAP